MFTDLLYGKLSLPEWIADFVTLPEFARLRGVRLSNVDSYQFKDLGSATRWEHSIGVAHLAAICAHARKLPASAQAELVLAGLLHDVASPPFGHTVETCLEGFDHEVETRRLLADTPSGSRVADSPVLGSALPTFHDACRKLRSRRKLQVDPIRVAEMVTGEGQDGFLICGTLDLDNTDNVIRGAVLMGLRVEAGLGEEVAEWLGSLDAPADLRTKSLPRSAKRWLDVRNAYYSAFYDANEAELGREAFLQHIVRRAIRAGVPHSTLVWNTDHGLLNAIRSMPAGPREEGLSLSDLVARYEGLESPALLFKFDVTDPSVANGLRNPRLLDWIERESGNQWNEICAISKWPPRSYRAPVDNLFPSPLATVSGYRIGGEPNSRSLPRILASSEGRVLSQKKLRQAAAKVLRNKAVEWNTTRPWLSSNGARKASVVKALESVGDWSFRQSRNQNLHAYPSTFVFALPATLLGCLGLRGAPVIDPFGGTGNTALEVVKQGGTAVSTDASTIATLIAKARLSSFRDSQWRVLGEIDKDVILSFEEASCPDYYLRDKWHHRRTLQELCRIWSFITSHSDVEVRVFLEATFSAVLTSATARSGRQHGFFADNTPLPKGTSTPPYVSAAALFTDRLKKNLGIASAVHAYFERADLDPEGELGRARVERADIRTLLQSKPALREKFAGVITSPPYLCMSDYTLGQRLSYYWLAPERAAVEFEQEIGARRLRGNPKTALKAYLDGMSAFAATAADLLQSRGYLAMILGEPMSRAFKDIGLQKQVVDLMTKTGMNLLWSIDRPISWHRNHGYERLMSERVSVFQKE